VVTKICFANLLQRSTFVGKPINLCGYKLNLDVGRLEGIDLQDLEASGSRIQRIHLLASLHHIVKNFTVVVAARSALQTNLKIAVYVACQQSQLTQPSSL
jgi:hypothetical protein